MLPGKLNLINTNRLHYDLVFFFYFLCKYEKENILMIKVIQFTFFKLLSYVHLLSNLVYYKDVSIYSCLI